MRFQNLCVFYELLPVCEFCCCIVFCEWPGVTQAPPGLGDTDADGGATMLKTNVICG